jgi:hypothetical protein
MAISIRVKPALRVLNVPFVDLVIVLLRLVSRRIGAGKYAEVIVDANQHVVE